MYSFTFESSAVVADKFGKGYNFMKVVKATVEEDEPEVVLGEDGEPMEEVTE